MRKSGQLEIHRNGMMIAKVSVYQPIISICLYFAFTEEPC
ncbi:hypothetical protein FHU10_2944 [Serratia fonticola]|uniref:Uncharacterized protein n=1 Tax=Serratia fonticola TaxID=47917 RepID=A0A542BU48_SERFO|nr:hypothetical protein FHU09_4766 [Serratia fonticola]TQI95878.1 hypothetical protein FHU11_1282 [Serratia fonticola]TVZ70375.1 hypothetical protein FHU10_2944 [Serratia fonticola]